MERRSSIPLDVSQPTSRLSQDSYPTDTSGVSTAAHSMISGRVQPGHGSGRDFRYADADFPAPEALASSNSVGLNRDANHASVSGGESHDDSINLEQRIRGMILKNAGAQAPLRQNAGHIATTSNVMPPHMQAASSPEKEAYLTTQQQRQNSSAVSSPPRKRMGQAQRRQLIPDSRFSNPASFFRPPGNMPAAVEGQMQLPSRVLPTTTAPVQAFPQRINRGSIQRFPHQFPAPHILPSPHNHVHGPGRIPSHPRRMNTQQPHVSHHAQRPLNNSSQDPITNQVAHNPHQEEISRQCGQLERLALEAVDQVAIDDQEIRAKDAFRAALEKVCREVIQEYEIRGGSGESFEANKVQLRSFGSLVTGFAVKNSDVDLMLLSPWSRLPLSSSESPIPRLLENRFLEMGWGAQLLTKTRVPIIKVCERPSQDLLESLRSQREKREAGENQAIMHEPHVEDLVQPEGDDTKQAVSAATNVKSLPAIQGPLIASAADLATLSQTNNEDIWRYYQKARNIFGRLENYNRSFPFHQRRNAEKQTVTLLTEAFISGLRDEDLKRRVSLHKSFQAENPTPYFRNLILHVGGEEIVMAWERRSVKETTAAKEAEAAAVVERWRELHEHTVVNNAETVKVLQEICSKLRSLPSAKLEMFSQRWDENPEGYYQRFMEILRGLNCRHLIDGPTVSSSPHERGVLLELIARFVNGINDEHIRSQLSEYMKTRDPSLTQLHRQHHAEYCIKRFESSVKKGIYSSDDREVVDECAALIRDHGAASARTEVIDAMDKLHDLTGRSSSTAKEKHQNNLEFPKTGVGVQCDINFANHLALHNTQLLRCYNLCDPRVRPMVLCIKAWAKRRKINSSYHGTLSSYGYVLMVLHYLMNIAVPPVLPNLQLAKRSSSRMPWRPSLDKESKVDGYDVHFWRDEEEIRDLARRGELTRNNQSLGALLRGFFDYYAHQGPRVIAYGFEWITDVISIRTPGGILTKHAKGWTGARTIVNEPTQAGQGRKEVRHRYLFAIEDPFELDHNVARTVTHEGMHGIRFELRRAWKIISESRGRDLPSMEAIFRSLDDKPESGMEENHTDEREQNISEAQTAG